MILFSGCGIACTRPALLRPAPLDPHSRDPHPCAAIRNFGRWRARNSGYFMISADDELRAEEADRQLRLREAAVVVWQDAVGVGVGAVGDHLVEVVVDVVRPHTVVAGQAAGE